MILIIYGAVPSAGQLVQLWDGTSVIIPRRVLLRFGAARGLVSQFPVDPNLVSATLAIRHFRQVTLVVQEQIYFTDT